MTRYFLHSFPKSWFSGRGWGQQLFRFRSPALQRMARTSSLNCLSCRNHCQTPDSLNCLPLFTESTFFPLKSASSHPLPKIGSDFHRTVPQSSSHIGPRLVLSVEREAGGWMGDSGRREGSQRRTGSLTSNLQGRALYGPMPVKTETFRELWAPLVHTNFGGNSYGPIIGPYLFLGKFVWTNGPESSSKVSPYIGIGPWMAIPEFATVAQLGTEFGQGDATKQKSVKRSVFSLNEGRAFSERRCW